MAELADAPDLGSGGQPWGFESLYPHHCSRPIFGRELLFKFKGFKLGENLLNIIKK